MTSKDVLRFVTAQRRPRKGAENVVRISDGGSGLSTSTIKRRLAAVLQPLWLPRRPGRRRRGDQPGAAGSAHPAQPSPRRDGAPLVRGVRRLPRILNPDEVEALMAALRTDRDRAMAQAMLLGGLRRGEVLGSDSKTFVSVSGASSSPTAREDTNAWCRSRPPSSPQWRTT